MKDLKMRKSGEPITKQELEQFISEFNLKLPKFYEDFILKHNGGYAEITAFGNPYEDGTAIDGFGRISLTDDTYEDLIDDEKISSIREIIQDLQIEENVIPNHLYPFGFDAGGNYFCISMAEEGFGAVCKFYVDGTADEPTPLSASFEEFINGLEDITPYREAEDELGY